MDRYFVVNQTRLNTEDLARIINVTMEQWKPNEPPAMYFQVESWRPPKKSELYTGRASGPFVRMNLNADEWSKTKLIKVNTTEARWGVSDVELMSCMTSMYCPSAMVFEIIQRVRAIANCNRGKTAANSSFINKDTSKVEAMIAYHGLQLRLEPSDPDVSLVAQQQKLAELSVKLIGLDVEAGTTEWSRAYHQKNLEAAEQRLSHLMTERSNILSMMGDVRSAPNGSNL